MKVSFGVTGQHAEHHIPMAYLNPEVRAALRRAETGSL